MTNDKLLNIIKQREEQKKTQEELKRQAELEKSKLDIKVEDGKIIVSNPSE